MNNVSRPTPGAGGVDPAGVGKSTGDGSDITDSPETSIEQAPSVDDAPDWPTFRPGGHSSASFSLPSATIQAARGAGTRLLDFGFEESQIEWLIGSPGQTGDARIAINKLSQVCLLLGMEGVQGREDHALWRAQFLKLLETGGPKALDALEAAYLNSETDVGALAAWLGELGGRYGHSYEQLARMGLHNAEALRELLRVAQVRNRRV